MDKDFLYKSCKICGEERVEPNHFWKTHHIKEADYAWTHEPKFSKLTGSLIKFKNRDFYYNSEFNDKNELKKWIKQNPSLALDYCLGLIEDRFTKKKITYAPSQVELRSICSPNVIWYQSACDYNLECKRMGLAIRFKYKISEIDYSKEPLHIVVDTREQKALKFASPTEIEVKKLHYGDYWAKNSQWNHVYIERKNLSDFIGTLSSGFERFQREIIRARQDNNYLIILVEESINNALAFNMLPHVSRNIKASPDFIFYKLRQLMQDYPNIQFVFVDGRVKAAEMITKIYQMAIDPSLLDLQFLIDGKVI